MARRLIALIMLTVIGTLFSLIIGNTTVQAQQYAGTNWNGSYYSDNNFSNLSFQRVDSIINFNYGIGAPSGAPSGFPADNFSIRWSGVQSFPQSGVYRFIISRDEDAEVRVGGQTVIAFQGAFGSGVYTGEAFLNAGNYEVTVSYKEFVGNALVQFYYEFNAGGTVGPTFTPTRTSLPPIPPGALTATVIRASVLNVRDAPSLGANRLGRILRGETYAVVGRDENARWFLLQLGGYQGWAWGYYLFINGNEFNAPIRSPFGTIGVPPGVVDTGVVAQSESTMRLRAEPNVASTQIGRITWGGFLPVVGRTADGYWYQVVWKGTVGWVYSPYLEIIQGDLNAVPVK
jgi:uncharacterized protein YraI